MNLSAFRLSLLPLLLVLTYCASQPSQPLPQSVDDSAQATLTAQANPPADIEYGAFTRDQLTEIILSELGGQRGDIGGAVQRYYRLAIESRDPGLIRRALQFASAAGETAIVVELAQLWSSITPDDLEPQLLLGYQLLDSGRLDEALQHLTRVLELGGAVDFTALSARTEDIPQEQRLVVLAEIRRLHTLYPQEDSLHYAMIQLLAQSGAILEALRELELIKAENGETARTLLVEAQLLQQLGRVDDAVALLARGVERYPELRIVRFNYAQVLVRADLLPAARDQFTILVRQEPGDFETQYSLALLNLEMQALDEARALFNRLLDVGYRNNDSHFYMGYINEMQGQISAAIGQYRQVQMDSSNYLNAQRQVIRLLIAQQRYDEAHQWAQRQSAGQPRLEALFAQIEAEALVVSGQIERARGLLDSTLASYPENTDLLFTRTLLHERNGDMVAAEVDLKRIIELQPNDARALNHLGYTLADRTDRHTEALSLIERAITVAPDDPAIIDSLGWVQYKLGRYEEALVNLRRAYELFPDHEVASHLGEVLWVMGRQQEAIDVWHTALEQRPDSDLLREVMDRFMPGDKS